MRIPAFLSLSLVTACSAEPTGPDSLGYSIGEHSQTVTAPSEGVNMFQWQLPDWEATDIAFFVQVQHEGRWIPDHENYEVRHIHSPPVRSTAQQTLSLCWVSHNKNGDTISAGAIPDTGGIIRFQLAYKESFAGAGIALVCNINNPDDQVTLGFGLASIRLVGPYEDGEFAWLDTYSGEYSERATSVVFVYPTPVVDTIPTSDELNTPDELAPVE